MLPCLRCKQEKPLHMLYLLDAQVSKHALRQVTTDPALTAHAAIAAPGRS